MQALKIVKPDLEELRRLIGHIDGSLKPETLEFSLLPKGLPKNAIVEITGVGKTEFLIQLLQEHPDLKVAWLEEEFSIYPTALLQKHVNLENVLFIETNKETLWTCRQVLQSQVFSIVVFSGLQFDTRNMQRLKLLVEKSKTTLFFLSEKPHQSWVQSLVIQTHKAPHSGELQIDVLKQRGAL